MAIEVNGKFYRTLADEFFLDHDCTIKVYKALVNGVQVYPDISGIPAYMKITTLPNKLVYKPGDAMDYTGIVCTLFNADGTVFTDERYPDGIIPFEELEFPIEKAPAVGMIYVTDGIPGGNLSFPIPLYPIAYLFKYYESAQVSRTDWFFPENDAYFIVNGINNRGIRGSSISKRQYAEIVRESDPPESYHMYLTQAGNAYENDGKIAYYGTGTLSSYSAYDSFFPDAGSGDINGVDAWNVLYGTREGDDSSIPVNWKSTYSGDDRTLTDKFNITNREVTS